jgi:hypothetical protein
MKKAFYYLRDHYNAPRITVCLMKDNHGIVCRGIALCSLNDNPSKKDRENMYSFRAKNSNYDRMIVTGYSAGGRTIAFQRAKKAFAQGCSTDVICREEALKVLSSVNDMQWLYKSEFDIWPRNEFEKKLIQKMD